MALLIATGIYCRFDRIDEHFCHIDDLVTIAGPYMINQGHPMDIPVPKTSYTFRIDAQRIKTNPVLYATYISGTQSYAPAQFLLYPFLLSGEYSYREYLWRGRFPCAFFSALTLFAFIALLIAIEPRLDVAALLGFAALALSLMQIIYAQQGGSYAIGGFAFALLLLILVRRAGKESSFRSLITLALLFTTLSYMNYQVLMMVPVAYLSLIFVEWRTRNPQPLRPLLKRYTASAVLWFVLAAPLYVFIKTQSHSGRFVATEGFEKFFLAGDSGWSHALSFYPRSLWTIFLANVSVVPESVLGSALAGALFLLALSGLRPLLSGTGASFRLLRIFIPLLVLSWVTLNALGRLPFSPTRHVIVLGPLCALLITLGARDLIERWRTPIGATLAGSLLALITASFLFQYEPFREQRKDKFDESQIRTLLETHHLDTVVGYASTWNPALMFRTSPDRPTFISLDDIIRKGPRSQIAVPDRSFLLVSHRVPIEGYPEAYQHLLERNFKIRPLVASAPSTETNLASGVNYGGNGLYISLAEK